MTSFEIAGNNFIELSDLLENLLMGENETVGKGVEAEQNTALAQLCMSVRTSRICCVRVCRTRYEDLTHMAILQANRTLSLLVHQSSRN